MSYYKSDLFLGNHEFKAGFDYMPNQIGWEYHQRGAAGEYRLIFQSGHPVPD